jgi:hypothetical protein
MPERVVVIEILIPQGRPYMRCRNRSTIEWVIRVGSRRSFNTPANALVSPTLSFALPQKHYPAIAGDIASGETRLDLAPIKAWKTEFILSTI